MTSHRSSAVHDDFVIDLTLSPVLSTSSNAHSILPVPREQDNNSNRVTDEVNTQDTMAAPLSAASTTAPWVDLSVGSIPECEDGCAVTFKCLEEAMHHMETAHSVDGLFDSGSHMTESHTKVHDTPMYSSEDASPLQSTDLLHPNAPIEDATRPNISNASIHHTLRGMNTYHASNAYDLPTIHHRDTPHANNDIYGVDTTHGYRDVVSKNMVDLTTTPTSSNTHVDSSAATTSSIRIDSQATSAAPVTSPVFAGPPLYAPQQPWQQQNLKLAPPALAGLTRLQPTGYPLNLRGRVPANAQMPLGVDISLVEICTFHPNAVHLPAVSVRFQRNKVPKAQVAELQLKAMGLDDGPKGSDRFKFADKVKHAFWKGGLHCYPVEAAKKNTTDQIGGPLKPSKYERKKEPKVGGWHKKIAELKGPDTDLTTNRWRPASDYRPASRRQESLRHYKLKDIYEHIEFQRWPKGKDRLSLTLCLEFARACPWLDLDTSHWDWIMSQFTGEQLPALGTSYERSGLTRDHEAIHQLKGKEIRDET